MTIATQSKHIIINLNVSTKPKWILRKLISIITEVLRSAQEIIEKGLTLSVLGYFIYEYSWGVLRTLAVLHTFWGPVQPKKRVDNL